LGSRSVTSPRAFSSVFEIDINTGLAGPSLGELGFVASSLAFVNVPEPTTDSLTCLLPLAHALCSTAS
jgi:hypothetical protein